MLCKTCKTCLVALGGSALQECAASIETGGTAAVEELWIGVE